MALARCAVTFLHLKCGRNRKTNGAGTVRDIAATSMPSALSFAGSLVVNVHDKYPLRWREEPYYSDIKSWAVHGLQADTWVTEVVVRDQLWVILPDKDILITSEYFHIVRRGSNDWDVIQRDMDENESRKLRLVEMRMRMAEAEELTAA